MEITWINYHGVEGRDDQWFSNVASVRYRLIIPARELHIQGHRVHLLQLAPQWRAEQVLSQLQGELVVISKIAADAKSLNHILEQTRKLVQFARGAGRKVVADICDDHFSHPEYGGYFRALVEMVDLVVASTKIMAATVRDHTVRPVIVVPDPYEGARRPVEFRPPVAKASGLLARVLQNVAGAGRRRTLQLLWFGHGSNIASVIELLPQLAPLVASHDLRLHVVTAPDGRLEKLCGEINAEYAPAYTVQFSPWSLDTTWQALQVCDLVVIPVRMNDPTKLVKGPNRPIEAIRAGRFVVARPIPAYQELADYAWLGDSIVDGVRWALTHRSEVKKKVVAGQRYIETHYAPEVVARGWGAALQAAISTGTSTASSSAIRVNLGSSGRTLPDYVGVDVAQSRSGARPDRMNNAGLAYLEWYYGANVWKHLYYRGVRTLKLPLDMWNYQEIIFENNLHWVVETGTRHGGSALFFADLMVAGGREGGVISIDLTHEGLSPVAAAHPRIRFLTGDSASDEMVKQAMGLIPVQRSGGLLLIFDSDHSAPHVLKELKTWLPQLKQGDYLIVEDTIVNGHPVRPEFGPGPLEAIVQYLAENPGRLQADAAREAKFACTFAACGYFKVNE